MTIKLYNIFDQNNFKPSDPVSIVINGNYAEYANGNVNYTDFACNSQGQWTSSTFGVVTSVICQRRSDTVIVTTALATTTTTSNGLCNTCPNIVPRLMGTGASYDGMLVINHFKDRATACRKAVIDCMGTMDYETAELYLDSVKINSSSQVEVSLQCTNNAVWMYENTQYSTASCLISSKFFFNQ